MDYADFRRSKEISDERDEPLGTWDLMTSKMGLLSPYQFVQGIMKSGGGGEGEDAEASLAVPGTMQEEAGANDIPNLKNQSTEQYPMADMGTEQTLPDEEGVLPEAFAEGGLVPSAVTQQAQPNPTQ